MKELVAVAWHNVTAKSKDEESRNNPFENLRGGQESLRWSSIIGSILGPFLKKRKRGENMTLLEAAKKGP